MGDHSWALREGTRVPVRSWEPTALVLGSLYHVVGPAAGDRWDEGSIVEEGMDFIRQAQLRQGPEK